MLITEHPMGVARQDPTPPKTQAPAVGALRADPCAMTDALDAAARSRASIVRSCSQIKRLTAVEREGLKDLLRCIAEQRKRLRALRRPLAEPRSLRTAVGEPRGGHRAVHPGEQRGRRGAGPVAAADYRRRGERKVQDNADGGGTAEIGERGSLCGRR